MPYDLAHVTEFCYTHQQHRDHKGVLQRKELNEWALKVITAAKVNKLYVVDNKDKALIGVCIGTEYPATKRVYVHEIVCIENAFPTFVRELKLRFPGYRVQGTRAGKLTTYNPENL